MKAREAISRRLVVVDADDLLEQAARRMLEQGIRHLPVVDHGRLVGLLSERDLLAFHGYGGLRAPVSAAMTREVHLASADDDLADVAARMASRKFGCMPIVDGHKLIGLVTTTDLLAGEVRRPTRPSRLLERTAADLMSATPLSVHPDDRLLDALARMANAGVRHLPVVDGDSRPVGMLSDRDVRRAIGDAAAREGEARLERRVAEYRVRDVASTPAVTVDEDAPLSAFLRRFTDDRLGALAVIDRDGRLAGVVSYVDVLDELAGAVHSPSGVAAMPPEPMLPSPP